MKYLGLNFASLLMFFSVSSGLAHANNVVSPCESCVTDQQSITKAMEVGLDGEDMTQAISKRVFLLNASTNQSRVYAVSHIPGEPGLPAQTFVNASSTSDAEQASIDHAMQSLSQIRDWLDFTFVVPDDVASSAFDLAWNDPRRNQVIQHYVSERNFAQTVLDYRSALVSVATKFLI